MKKCIENCRCVKIVLTGVVGLVLIGIIIGIWRCKANGDFNNYKDLLPEYNSGVVIVRENNAKTIKSYTVTQYNTLEKYVDNASDNDIVYVYDSKNKICAATLAKLGEKKNIELRFMVANSKVIIKEKKSKKSVEHNKNESEQKSTAQDGSNNKT